MHTRLRARRRRGLAALILAITIGSPIASSASEWQHAGLQHVEFARALGREGARFNSDFMKWVAGFVDEDCQVKPGATRLQARDCRRVELVGTRYCKPWEQAWEVCAADQPPSWCGSPAAMATEFEKYFATLATALKSTQEALQRYNLMAMVAVATAPHAITQFPVDRVDLWVATPAKEFLRTATPDEAIQIARLLQGTWFGLGPVTAGHFKTYATSRVVSEEQRRLLNDIASKRHGR